MPTPIVMFTVWMFTFVVASRGILYDSIAFLFGSSSCLQPRRRTDFDV